MWHSFLYRIRLLRRPDISFEVLLARESATVSVEALSASLSQGTTWQRICTIIELENSQSKTIARSGPNATDLTRFKEVLLRLKREGDAAPGAAGY